MLNMRIGGRFLGILKHYGENHKIGFLQDQKPIRMFLRSDDSSDNRNGTLCLRVDLLCR